MRSVHLSTRMFKVGGSSMRSLATSVSERTDKVVSPSSRALKNVQGTPMLGRRAF